MHILHLPYLAWPVAEIPFRTIWDIVVSLGPQGTKSRAPEFLSSTFLVVRDKTQYEFLDKKDGNLLLILIFTDSDLKEILEIILIMEYVLSALIEKIIYHLCREWSQCGAKEGKSEALLQNMKSRRI